VALTQGPLPQGPKSHGRGCLVAGLGGHGAMIVAHSPLTSPDHVPPMQEELGTQGPVPGPLPHFVHGYQLDPVICSSVEHLLFTRLCTVCLRRVLTSGPPLAGEDTWALEGSRTREGDDVWMRQAGTGREAQLRGGDSDPGGNLVAEPCGCARRDGLGLMQHPGHVFGLGSVDFEDGSPRGGCLVH
jgi:hypothetical protein